MHYRSLAIGLLCSALAACTGDPGDEGTYHLALTLNTQTSSPLDTLPSKVSWPSATDREIQVVDTPNRGARIAFFGEQIDADATRLTATDPLVRADPSIAAGTLLLSFGSKFRVTVEDTVACPQTYPTSLHGSTVLYVLNGHVRGGTTDDETCSLDPIPYARFFFDVAGDRAKD